MIELLDWRGELAGRRVDVAVLRVETILPERADTGGSRPIQVIASDRERYWLKVANNPQHPNIPVAEQIVGACGALIKAPVRPVELVAVPEEFAGYEFHSGSFLEPGIAHGSLNLENAHLTWELDHPERDENTVRYLEFAALYDWCWGDDCQWLYQVGSEADYEYYSHDHGYYLLGPGNWTRDRILEKVYKPHALPVALPHASPEHAVELAERIAAVSHSQILTVLSGIPASWNVSDEQLELLGFFLEARLDDVAARVRTQYVASSRN